MRSERSPLPFIFLEFTSCMDMRSSKKERLSKKERREVNQRNASHSTGPRTPQGYRTMNR
jgi:hypothetical protein